MKINVTESWEWNANLNDIDFLGLKLSNNKENFFIVNFSRDVNKINRSAGILSQESYFEIYNLLIPEQNRPKIPQSEFSKLLKSKIKITEIKEIDHNNLNPSKNKQYKQFKIDSIISMYIFKNNNMYIFKNNNDFKYLINLSDNPSSPPIFTTIKDYAKIHNLYVQNNKIKITPKYNDNPLYGIEP